MEKYDPELIKSLIEKADSILEINKKTNDAIAQFSARITQIEKQVHEIMKKLTAKGLLN